MSCVSLIYLLQQFPDSFVPSLNIYIKFSSVDIPDLLAGLELSASKIHKRMIRVFRWIIEYQSK